MNELTGADRVAYQKNVKWLKEHTRVVLEYGRRLLEVKNSQAWMLYHATFEEFCEVELDLSFRTAQSYLQHAKEIAKIGKMGCSAAALALELPKLPATVIHEVATHESPEHAAAVLEEVLEEKPAEKVTLADIRPYLEPSDNGHPEKNGELIKEPVEPLWKQFASLHAEALNHLAQARGAIKKIEQHGEDASYLAHVMTRINQDYKNLRTTIGGNTPVELKRGNIVTKAMQRK